jgi:FKBP-type peptidyl-prolyl cis-trans isomerase
MKKISIIALLIVFGISFCQAQNIADFNLSPTGLYYKFHVKTDSERVKLYDIIIAEVWVYLDDSLDYTNAGFPEPMFQMANSHHGGDLMDALYMVGKGDSVTFAFNLDTLRKYNNLGVLEDNKSLLYTIKVHGAYTEAEFEDKMEVDRIRGEAEEVEKLKVYIKQKEITVNPNADGIYVILEKELPIVITGGKNVWGNYTASLLDGTVVSTNIESVAKEHSINPQQIYKPLQFLAGWGQVIEGIDNAVMGMQIGTKARLIIPSNMAYGSSNYILADDGNTRIFIPAYSTLIYDIEIVDVK